MTKAIVLAPDILKRMAVEYLAGASLATLGAAYGLSSPTVRRRLLAIGVRMRSLSEAALLAHRRPRKPYKLSKRAEHSTDPTSYCTKCGIIIANCEPEIRVYERDGTCGHCILEELI